MKDDRKILKFLRSKVANQAPAILPEDLAEELDVDSGLSFNYTILFQLVM